MAPSNNSIADGLLASAHDSAVHDGLRVAVVRYLEAADALIAEDRRDEAMSVLAELLSAKEKRRGFFFGKREQSALGNQRAPVAVKYAQLALHAPPTENSLDTLNQLAIEFPDDFDVRIANAEALRRAGYLLDALDEYKYCGSLQTADVDLDVRLGEVYSQLGRDDDAIGHARHALSEYAKSGNDAAVATFAIKLLDFAPTAFNESFYAFASMTPDVLAKHQGDLETVAAAFIRSDEQDPDRRTALVSRLASCYEKLLARDRSNEKLWAALAKIDPTAVEQVRERLDGKTAAVPEPAPASAPEPPAAIVPVSPAPQPQSQSQQRPQPEAVAAPSPGAPKRPAAGGLSAFAKRKALELFANSEYEAASAQLERVVKMSPDAEALEMLLECYLVLDRHADAARIGVQLADTELAAGNRPGAIATLTTLSKKIADPNLEQRRVDLMQNK